MRPEGFAARPAGMWRYAELLPVPNVDAIVSLGEPQTPLVPALRLGAALGLRDLWRDRPERSAVWTVIAALIKPQLAILVPIVAVVTIRRALWPVDPATAEASDLPEGAGILDRIRAWERRTGRPIRILTTGLAGLVTTFVLSAPVGLSVCGVAMSDRRTLAVAQAIEAALQQT